MRNKLSCNRGRRVLPTNRQIARLFLGIAACLLACVSPAAAGGDAPQWMHALVNAPLPAHDDKTDAVLLYSEKTVAVLSADKIKKTVRVAYKILRPGGRDYGVVLTRMEPFRIRVGLEYSWGGPDRATSSMKEMQRRLR